MNAKLAEQLKKLRLSGITQTLEVRLQEAAANRLDHVEFLELVLADEMAVRQERLIGRGLKAAEGPTTMLRMVPAWRTVGPAIPCWVAPQQSPTPFRQAT